MVCLTVRPCIASAACICCAASTSADAAPAATRLPSARPSIFCTSPRRTAVCHVLHAPARWACRSRWTSRQSRTRCTLMFLRPSTLPPAKPGGSACCYRNGYGTQWNHPAQGQPLFEPGGSACRHWNGYGITGTTRLKCLPGRPRFAELHPPPLHHRPAEAGPGALAPGPAVKRDGNAHAVVATGGSFR